MTEEDDLGHPIGNDGIGACGVFLLLARRTQGMRTDPSAQRSGPARRVARSRPRDAGKRTVLCARGVDSN